MERAGQLIEKRRRQMLRWMRSMVDEQLGRLLAAHPAVGAIRGQVEAEVLAGRLPAGAGPGRSSTPSAADNRPIPGRLRPSAPRNNPADRSLYLSASSAAAECRGGVRDAT